jgi:ABC-type multidrug transport system ATPase subunit
MTPAARAAVTRKVGFAPADTVLPSHLRVRTALSYLAALWQVPGQARIDAEMERWDLVPLQRQRLGSISPGERRRFVLAASLVMSPDLWLLEHPFDGLDLPGRNLLRQLLISAALDGGNPRRVLLAHHDDDVKSLDLPAQTHLVASAGEVSRVAP